MRRIAWLVVVALAFAAPGLGEPEREASPGVALTPISEGALRESLPFDVPCGAALLCEQESGQVIWEMNADAPRPVASVTKLMTILLTLEELDAGRLELGEERVISAEAAGMGGSQVLLDVGERQTVGQLLKAMVVGSANDAAVALAEAMYGSEAACVAEMNRRAKALGMAETVFMNCTGLPAEGQHTTARDVAAMSRAVFGHELYYDYSGVWMEDFDHGDGRVTQLVNTNRLIRLMDGCDGGKTGSTGEAGYCVSATAKRGDMRLVAVALGAGSGKERFAIARKLLEYGFANYRRYPVAARGTRVRGALPVTGGRQDGVALMLDGDLTLLVEKGGESGVALVPELPGSVPAPVEAGQAVGSVTVTLEGRPVARIPVVTCERVEAKGIGGGLRRILEMWTAGAQGCRRETEAGCAEEGAAQPPADG